MNANLLVHITSIPDDIFPDSGSIAQPLIIHDYEARVGSFKGKSILTRNAISLVIKGNKTMHFAEKTVHVNDGEIHFLSAGHCIATMKLAEHHSFRSILIFFDNQVLANFYLKYDGLISAVQSKPKIEKEYYLSFRKDEFIYHYIESLQLMLKEKKQMSTEMKLLKFEELMLHLLDKYPSAILSFQPIKKSDFDDIAIKRIAEANIKTNISIEELAFLCNMSESTFKRRFNSIYGVPPGKWMLHQRMQIAKELLQFHKERPADIYHKLGYENHSSFSQQFRQIVGVTPKQYQLQMMNVQQ